MLFNGFPECGAVCVCFECLVGESSREGQSDRKRIPVTGSACLWEKELEWFCGDSDLMLCVQMERATHDHGVTLGGCAEVCEKVLDLKSLAAI